MSSIKKTLRVEDTRMLVDIIVVVVAVNDFVDDEFMHE